MLQVAVKSQNATIYEIPDYQTCFNQFPLQTGESYQTLVIPKQVMQIDERVWSFFPNLEEIIVSDENKAYMSIEGVLYHQSNKHLLKYPPKKRNRSFTIWHETKQIGANAMFNQIFLESIFIPNGVQKINHHAFAHCESLHTVWISKTIETIEPYAFYDCQRLFQITVEAENANYQSILGSLYSKDGKILCQLAIGRYWDKWIVPQTVETIAPGAAYGCKTLQTVYLFANLQLIGEKAFAHCPQLVQFVIDENNQNYCSIAGHLYTKNQQQLLQYAIGQTQDVFLIPRLVKRIGEYAFYQSQYLKSVFISKNIVVIARTAFAHSKRVAIIYEQSKSDNRGLCVKKG